MSRYPACTLWDRVSMLSPADIFNPRDDPIMVPSPSALMYAVEPSQPSPHGAIGQHLQRRDDSSPLFAHAQLGHATHPYEADLDVDLAELIAQTRRQQLSESTSLPRVDPTDHVPRSVASSTQNARSLYALQDAEKLWSDPVSHPAAFQQSRQPDTQRDLNLSAADISQLSQRAPQPPRTDNPSSPSRPSTTSVTQPAQPPFAAYPTPISRPAARGQQDVSVQVVHHLAGLSALLKPMMGKSEEVVSLKAEVQLWKDAWGKLERERQRLEETLADKKPKPIGPIFTAVLIDGDGLIFQDKLLSLGYKGGQQAARTLLSAIPKLAPHADSPPNVVSTAEEIIIDAVGSYPDDESVEDMPQVGSVIVQIFLNKAGLGATLVKAGSVSAWGVYESFWQGFSSAHELFTVIDVGNGKEASDVKIREHLKLYAKHAQCDMIVLGASHDNGYANILASLQTESRLSKLLLLKGYADLAPQLRQYSSRVVTIPDLFRTTKLRDLPATFSFIAAQQKEQKEQKEAAISQTKTLAKTATKVVGGSNKENRKPPLLETADSEDSIEEYQWEEALTSALATAKKKDEDEWTEAKKAKKYKPGKGEGKKVGTVRDLQPRPCHLFYLSDYGCKAGDECDYGHNYDLSESQTVELARLAKEIICPFVRNNKCRFEGDDCVYGHRCPRMEKCTFGETCRFNILPNGHGID